MTFDGVAGLLNLETAAQAYMATVLVDDAVRNVTDVKCVLGLR